MSSPPAAPLSSPTSLTPHSLSQPVVIVIASLVSTAVSLTVVLGVIHCIRRRRHKKAHTQHQRDVENCLARARRPVLAVDTDVPRTQNYTSTRTVTDFPLAGESRNVPFVPMAQTQFRTKTPVLPERVFSEGSQLVRSATRKPLASHPPGIGGRSLSRPARFEEVGLESVEVARVPTPIQVYDSQGKRTIYFG